VSRSPVRVLVVTTVPVTYAAFLVPYTSHLRTKGWRVDLATGPGEIGEDAAHAIDRRFELPWSRRIIDPRNATSAVRAARRVLHSGGYSIVHTHTPIASFIVRGAASSLSRRVRPAVVYTAHGFHFAPGRSRLNNATFASAEWLAGRRTDRLVVINEPDLLAARRLRLVPPEHLVYMPGIGIDLDWYRPTRALTADADAVRCSLGLAPDTPLVSSVAEMTPNKQHHVALRALRIADRADTHLAFAGTGPMRAELEALAVQLGITDRVHFLGSVADVRPLILASRATVLPSKREGLSRSVLESLALGVPVVGSDIRGIADSVRPDGGILVPPGDVGALAAAFDQIIASPKPSEPARSRIRQRLERFGLKSLIDAHDRLYEALLEERVEVTANGRGV
jgi:glycosyltransferase involved in cell wall biosynthesis